MAKVLKTKQESKTLFLHLTYLTILWSNWNQMEAAGSISYVYWEGIPLPVSSVEFQ